jgi:uncharacterized protein
VACRRSLPKRQLVRLVRAGDRVEVDETARQAGRGAYLCPEPACWEKALKGGQLEKALRGTLSREDRQRLQEQGEKMLKEFDCGQGQ